MKAKNKPRFALTIEAAADTSDEGGIRRLRAFLKSLLRSHGCRCISVVPVDEPAEGQEKLPIGNKSTP